MSKKKKEETINIDGKDFVLNNLTDNAKSQITNLQFVDAQIQQLNNELAIADTARIGYTNALKAELTKLKGNSE